MTDIPTLQALYTEAEAKHQQAIADNPLPRSPEEQAWVDVYLDALLTASAALRAAKRMAYWDSRDKAREKLHAEYEWLGGHEDVL